MDQLDGLQDHPAQRPSQRQRAADALLDRFGSWDSTRDSKINALVDLLRNEHPGEKVLVFTEYADTAEYVAQALRDAGITGVGLVSGNTDNPAGIARRFAPHGNGCLDKRKPY